MIKLTLVYCLLHNGIHLNEIVDNKIFIDIEEFRPYLRKNAHKGSYDFKKKTPKEVVDKFHKKINLFRVVEVI